ncbi:tail fiber protein [Bradyrhizobium sp. SZCCHNS2015]|uniref:tail fiber protein n=1 Tax=Bradyrhizobium sp. SZCCHNS2015 TaxID=3057305 RepID=UPI0028F03C9A|nr:tail fiber protein [Bradyrhizobium sp. SZCCHNS2015]
MTFFKWSQIAGNNGNADTTCPFPEGMAPSAVNDGVRGAMAALAKYRDDVAGAIVTAGTSTAYTLASYQAFDTLVHLDRQVIAFSPHVTNGSGPVTLNVDGLGAKPLRSAPGAELQAGVLIQGTPYTALYSAADGVFYLEGFFGNPYSIPLGGGIDYWAPTAPNSSFAFPYGQAISRTAYAALFALIGTTYGTGDGTTTFNLPDKRGRVSACPDNMGGTTANRLVTGSMASTRHTLGAAGGEDAHALTVNEMPSHYHGAGIYDPGHGHGLSSSQSFIINGSGSGIGGGGAFGLPLNPTSYLSVNAAVTNVRVTSSNGLDTTASTGGSAAHNVVQPTILCNYIMRVV